ncbi:hypothetical protein [Nostoc sp. FACHB-145]|uniref:hypothetical protein n=1 Tax=Nostoc sp. FACHB-145 TaxID=2692836 RepID=UPI001682E2B0|nr:hypothetical protein [Nostoc sp. FACHB-145]MBD2472047.1 hypothetical protein [Nostoc sp. FACHB-145]
MQDSIFIIFIGFGLIWAVMGVVAVVAFFKSDGQPLRFDKWGLIVAIPIIVPIVFVLLYQLIRPYILQF